MEEGHPPGGGLAPCLEVDPCATCLSLAMAELLEPWLTADGSGAYASVDDALGGQARSRMMEDTRERRLDRSYDSARRPWSKEEVEKMTRRAAAMAGDAEDNPFARFKLNDQTTVARAMHILADLGRRQSQVVGSKAQQWLAATGQTGVNAQHRKVWGELSEVHGGCTGGGYVATVLRVPPPPRRDNFVVAEGDGLGDPRRRLIALNHDLSLDVVHAEVARTYHINVEQRRVVEAGVEAIMFQRVEPCVVAVDAYFDARLRRCAQAAGATDEMPFEDAMGHSLPAALGKKTKVARALTPKPRRRDKKKAATSSTQHKLLLVDADTDATLAYRHATYPDRRRVVSDLNVWRRATRDYAHTYANLARTHATRLGSDRIIFAHHVGGACGAGAKLGSNALVAARLVEAAEEAEAVVRTLAEDGGLVLWELACDGGWAVRLRVPPYATEAERRTHAAAAARASPRVHVDAERVFPDELAAGGPRKCFDHCFVFATADVGRAARRAILYLAASDATGARHAGACTAAWIGYKAWVASWWECAAKRAEAAGEDATNYRASFALKERGVYRAALAQLVADGFLESALAMGVHEFRLVERGEKDALTRLAALSGCLCALLAAGEEVCGISARLANPDSLIAGGCVFGPGQVGIAGGALGFRMLSRLVALVPNDEADADSTPHLDPYQAASYAARCLSNLLCGTRRHFLPADHTPDRDVPPSFDACVDPRRGHLARANLAEASQGPGLNATVFSGLRSPYAVVRKSLADAVAMHSLDALDRSFLLVDDSLDEAHLAARPRDTSAVDLPRHARRAPLEMAHTLVDDMSDTFVRGGLYDETPRGSSLGEGQGRIDVAATFPDVAPDALVITQACALWGCTAAVTEKWRSMLQSATNLASTESDPRVSADMDAAVDAADASTVQRDGLDTARGLGLVEEVPFRFLDKARMQQLLDCLRSLVVPDGGLPATMSVEARNKCAEHIIGTLAALLSASGHPSVLDLLALEPEELLLSVLVAEDMGIAAKALSTLALANATAELARLEEMDRLAGMRLMERHGKNLSAVLRDNPSVYFASSWRDRCKRLLDMRSLTTMCACAIAFSKVKSASDADREWTDLLRDGTTCCCQHLMHTSLAILDPNGTLPPNDPDLLEERRMICHLVLLDDRPRVLKHLGAAVWGSIRDAKEANASSWLSVGCAYAFSEALNRIIARFPEEWTSGEPVEGIVDAAAWMAAALWSITRIRRRRIPEVKHPPPAPPDGAEKNADDAPGDADQRDCDRTDTVDVVDGTTAKKDLQTSEATAAAQPNDDGEDAFVQDDGGLVYIVKPLSALVNLAAKRRRYQISSGVEDGEAVGRCWNELVHASSSALECLFSLHGASYGGEKEVGEALPSWLAGHAQRCVEIAARFRLPDSLLAICGAEPNESDVRRLIEQDAAEMRSDVAGGASMHYTGARIAWRTLGVHSSIAMASAARCYYSMVAAWGGLDVLFDDPPPHACALPRRGRSPFSAFQASRLAVVLCHSKFRAKQHVGFLLAAHISGFPGPVGAYCRHVMVASPESNTNDALGWPLNIGVVGPLFAALDEEAELSEDGDADAIFREFAGANSTRTTVPEHGDASHIPPAVIHVASALLQGDKTYTPTPIDDDATSCEMCDPRRRRRYRMLALQTLANLLSVEGSKKRATDCQEITAVSGTANASDALVPMDTLQISMTSSKEEGAGEDLTTESEHATRATSYEDVARIVLKNQRHSLDNLLKVVRRSVRALDTIFSHARTPQAGASYAMNDSRFDAFRNHELRYLLGHTIEASRQCAEMLTSLGSWPAARTPLYRKHLSITSALAAQARGDPNAESYFVERFDALFFDPPMLTATRAWEAELARERDGSRPSTAPPPDGKLPTRSTWAWTYQADRHRYPTKHLSDAGGAGRLHAHRSYGGKGNTKRQEAEAHWEQKPRARARSSKPQQSRPTNPEIGRSSEVPNSSRRRAKQGEAYLITESAPAKLLGMRRTSSHSTRRPHSSLATAPTRQPSIADSLPRHGADPFSRSESRLGTPASESARRFLRWEASMTDVQSNYGTEERPKKEPLPRAFHTPDYDATRGGFARASTPYQVPRSVPMGSNSACGAPAIDWTLPEAIRRKTDGPRRPRRSDSRFMDWETEHYGQRLASAASEEAASEVVLRREMAHQRSDGVPLLESKKMRPTPMSVELRRSRSETASAVNSLIATSRGMDEELEQELAEMDAEPSIGAFSVDADADADADADLLLHDGLSRDNTASDLFPDGDDVFVPNRSGAPQFRVKSRSGARDGAIPENARGDVAVAIQSLRERRSKLWTPTMATHYATARALGDGPEHPLPPPELELGEDLCSTKTGSDEMPGAFPSATFGFEVLAALDGLASANGYFPSHGKRWIPWVDADASYPSSKAAYSELVDRRRMLVAAAMPSSNATRRKGSTGEMEWIPSSTGDMALGLPSRVDLERALNDLERSARRLADWATDDYHNESFPEHRPLPDEYAALDAVRKRNGFLPSVGDAASPEREARVVVGPGRPGDTVRYTMEPAVARLAVAEDLGDGEESPLPPHARPVATSHRLDLFESVPGSAMGTALAPTYDASSGDKIHYYRRQGRCPPPLALTWDAPPMPPFTEQQLLRMRLHPVTDICLFAPGDPNVTAAVRVLPPPKPQDEVCFVPMPPLPPACAEVLHALDQTEPKWECAEEPDAVRIVLTPDDRAADGVTDRWRYPGRLVDPLCRLDFEARCIIEVEDVDLATKERNKWRIENSVFAPRPVECAAHAYLDFHYYPGNPFWIGYSKLVCKPDISYAAFESDWRMCVSKTRFTHFLTEIVHDDMAVANLNLVHDNPAAFEVEFSERLKRVRSAAREIHPRIWAAFDYYRMLGGSGDDGTVTLNEFTTLCEDSMLKVTENPSDSRKILDRIFHDVNISVSEEGGRTNDGGLERREFFDAMIRTALTCRHGKQPAGDYVEVHDALRAFASEDLACGLPPGAQPYWYVEECASKRGEILLALPEFQPKRADGKPDPACKGSSIGQAPRSRKSSLVAAPSLAYSSDDEQEQIEKIRAKIEALDPSKDLHVDGREVTGAVIEERQSSRSSVYYDADDEKLLHPLSSTHDFFRAQRLYTPEVDRMLKKRYRFLRTLFHCYVERAPELAPDPSAGGGALAPDSRPASAGPDDAHVPKIATGRLGMKGFDMLLRDTSVIRLSSFGRREAQLAFVASVPAVPDVGSDEENFCAVRNRTLTFVGFLEVLGRIAEALALPSRKDIDTWAVNSRYPLDRDAGEKVSYYDYCASVSAGWGTGNGCALRQSAGMLRASKRTLAEKYAIFLELVGDGLRRKLDVQPSALEVDLWRKEPVRADNALADVLASRYLSAHQRSILKDALQPAYAPGTRRYRERPSVALHGPMADRMVVPMVDAKDVQQRATKRTIEL